MIKTVRALVEDLKTAAVPPGIRDEKDFEQRFVERKCVDRLELVQPPLEIAVHPWGDPAKAKAWADSKRWASVKTWGMKHTFDLVARKPDDSWKLAVEVKLAKVRNGRLPTGDFQRMMGQCHLARLRHDAVIAVFGYIGDLQANDKKDDGIKDCTDDLPERGGIWVVVRQVG